MTISRWKEFRDSSPFLSLFLAITVAALLLTSIALLIFLGLYKGELMAVQSRLTLSEQRRVFALSSTQNNKLSLAIELTKRLAQIDSSVHLTIDTQKQIMVLARHNATLREMSVQIGASATIDTKSDQFRISIPLGQRHIVKVVDADYPWVIPDWLIKKQGLQLASGNVLSGALGSCAVILNGGTVIYTRPSIGPLNDATYVLPGSIRMTTQDARAIRKELRPGMDVYFY